MQGGTHSVTVWAQRTRAQFTPAADGALAPMGNLPPTVGQGVG